MTCSLVALAPELFCQQGHWEVYLAQYEQGPGSTLVNMELKKSAPQVTHPFLFSAGVRFTNCTGDGLPAPGEFEKLNPISDSIASLMNRHVKYILAGTFTYQCERRDYYYVADTSNLRDEVTKLVTRNFPGYSPLINTKTDAAWEAYLTFLYPSETIMEYITNEKVILQLVKAGDQLEKPRQVDHWLYFKTAGDRNCFIDFAIKQKYKIEKTETARDSPMIYKLQISRTDFVNAGSINKVTLELKAEAKKCNGSYDGWETFVVK